MWYTLACLFSHSIEKLISTKLNSELNMKRKTRKLSTSLCSSSPHWYYDVFPSKSISQQKVLLFLFSPPPTYAFQFDDDSYMLFSPYTKVIKLTYRMLVGSLVYSSYYCWLKSWSWKISFFLKSSKIILFMLLLPLYRILLTTDGGEHWSLQFLSISKMNRDRLCKQHKIL